jgi:hypothetical protein
MIVANLTWNIGRLLLFPDYSTNLHQIWWKCNVFDEERNFRVKTVHSAKSKMVAVAILDSKELMLFLNYTSNLLQFRWECSGFNIVRNCHVTNANTAIFNMVAAVILNFDKFFPVLY